ncbi:hypothetical protein COL922a_013992, partial [Colletotrichum nupharicola]
MGPGAICTLAIRAALLDMMGSAVMEGRGQDQGQRDRLMGTVGRDPRGLALRGLDLQDLHLKGRRVR